MTFGEYMFELLFAPLKRAKKSINQFWIFFKVIGMRFDRLKQSVFQVREESMLISASDSMLPVHGTEHQMLRIRGETLDNYRMRLLSHARIAEAAGTDAGIRYLAQAFGYENVEILPSPNDGAWAEAVVQFIGGRIVLDDREILLQELDKIKPARTVLTLAKEQRYTSTVHVGSAYIVGRQLTIRQG